MEIIELTLSGFIGAFFAFIFFQIAESLKKKRERKRRHFNAVVSLQHILNGYISLSYTNIDSLKKILYTFKNRKENEAPINYIHLYPYELRKDVSIDLYNLDLVNDLTQFNFDLEKINYTIESFEQNHSDLRSSLLAKSIHPQDYIGYISTIIDGMEDLELFLVHVEKNTRKLFAITKVIHACVIN